MRCVVLRFCDDFAAALPYDTGAHESVVKGAAIEPVADQARGARFAPLFASSTLPELERFDALARASATGSRRDLVRSLPPLRSYYRLALAPDVDATRLAAALSLSAVVAETYVEPPVEPMTLDPHVRWQTYLAPAQLGVNARYAWQERGGAGGGVRIADLGLGWLFDHEDFICSGCPDGKFQHLGGLHVYRRHGIATSGIIAATKNRVGCQGIAYECEAFHTSSVVRRMAPYYDESAADALKELLPTTGLPDVVAIEIAYRIDLPGRSYHAPLEHVSPVKNVMIKAEALGVTFVEPAGNAGSDLAAIPRFRTEPDSGAILVGAVELSAGRQVRVEESNFGRRVDCYGPGRGVYAPFSDNEETARNQYTNHFEDTSAATAVVAGVVASMIGMARARTPLPLHLAPSEIREILRSTGTPCFDRSGRFVGHMPDLKVIYERHIRKSGVTPVGS